MKKSTIINTLRLKTSFDTQNYGYIFRLDDDVLEWFNLIDGTSERCHLAAIDSFEWEVNRKGRYLHIIKNRYGKLILGSLRELISINPEHEAEARVFSALVMDAAKKYTL